MGGKAIDFNGKVRALRRTLFPPPPQADLGDIATARYLAPIELPHVVIAREVSKAIQNPAVDKALGRTGIPNRFLRLLIGEPIIGAIVYLFQAYIEAGYYPTQFKEANTVILKKLAKKDYLEPKSYRLIILLNTLGKALETVVLRKLSDLAEKYYLLLL